MPLRGNYDGSTFGTNAQANEAHNEAMALAQLDRHIRDGMRIVILDGHSTAHCALRLFDSTRKDITVWTPSVAIASEFALARPLNPALAGWHLHMPEGKFNPDLWAVFGSRAVEVIATEAASADLVIISVKQLLGTEGPIGKEPQSISLKREAAAKANKVIWIADWTKLACATASGPKVYHHTRDEWTRETTNERTHVVITTPPGFDPSLDPGQTLPDPPTTPQDLYRRNFRRLRDLLQNRLQVVRM